MTVRVLVLGGSGFVGRHLIEQFQRADITVTVPTRRYANARELWPLPCATLVEADVTAEGVIERLVQGHDAVVNLVATHHGKSALFERLHADLPRRLAAACQAAQVRRVIHVSALGVAADAPSEYLRTKFAGEQALLEAAQQGYLDLTVFRPSVIYGADDRFLNVFARLQHTYPLLPLACPNARMQPVWVRNVADAIVHCVRDRAAIGQIVEAVGPDVWKLRDLVRSAGAWSGVADGRGRAPIGLPASLGWLQAFFMELLPGMPLLSRDRVHTLKIDSVASGKLPTLSDLGIELASLQAVAPTYLGFDGSIKRLDVYRQTAGR